MIADILPLSKIVSAVGRAGRAMQSTPAEEGSSVTPIGMSSSSSTDPGCCEPVQHWLARIDSPEKSKNQAGGVVSEIEDVLIQCFRLSTQQLWLLQRCIIRFEILRGVAWNGKIIQATWSPRVLILLSFFDLGASYYISAAALKTAHYQALLNRGWRRYCNFCFLRYVSSIVEY
jgi:hypothetical protein